MSSWIAEVNPQQLRYHSEVVIFRGEIDSADQQSSCMACFRNKDEDNELLKAYGLEPNPAKGCSASSGFTVVTAVGTVSTHTHTTQRNSNKAAPPPAPEEREGGGAPRRRPQGARTKEGEARG